MLVSMILQMVYRATLRLRHSIGYQGAVCRRGHGDDGLLRSPGSLGAGIIIRNNLERPQFSRLNIGLIVKCTALLAL